MVKHISKQWQACFSLNNWAKPWQYFAPYFYFDKSLELATTTAAATTIRIRTRIMKAS